MSKKQNNGGAPIQSNQQLLDRDLKANEARKAAKAAKKGRKAQQTGGQGFSLEKVQEDRQNARREARISRMSFEERQAMYKAQAQQMLVDDIRRQRLEEKARTEKVLAKRMEWTETFQEPVYSPAQVIGRINLKK